MPDDDKASVGHVEELEALGGDNSNRKVMGTVKLTEGAIVYIPTPTADPRGQYQILTFALFKLTVTRSIEYANMAKECCPCGNLNLYGSLPGSARLLLTVLVSTLGLALVSGFGGLLGFYIPGYEAAGKGYNDITHLMTYPTLFMYEILPRGTKCCKLTRVRGIGNLIGMPLAIGIGRRIVLLGSTAVLVLGAVLCATAKDYEWHLASRMVVGLAAGQSEALVPMITQVIRSILTIRAVTHHVLSVSRRYTSCMSAARLSWVSKLSKSA